jgi:aminopeptidase
MTTPQAPESINESDLLAALAELAVCFGANLQPGQILTISSEPGQENLARAIAETAYRHGARYVDLNVFDLHLKRARALYAAPDTLDYVPPWLGARVLQVGELRCARVGLTGPVEPHVMDGVDPELLGRDMLPALHESIQVVDARTTNWTAVPCPTGGWAAAVYPDLEPPTALARLWADVAHICRLDEPDPAAAWEQRLDDLMAVSARLEALGLDALHFEGPGTDLTIGLFASSHWSAARFETVDGLVHAPNLPTEEVFTTPDPARVDGVATSTKPLFAGGTMITGLSVRFEGGHAVSIEADRGGEVLRAMSRHDENASRLGEVALVDRQGRIGPLGTVFYDTLIDENAASHIAIGQAYETGVRDVAERELVNRSSIHVDFMIGADDVAVTGLLRDGSRVPLLRDGDWQI